MTNETAVEIQSLREAQEIGEASGNLIVRAREFSIDSPEENDDAADLVRALRSAKKGVAEAFDPVCTATHKAHQAATGARKKYLKPIEDAILLVAGAMNSWTAEQTRLAKVSRTKLLDAAGRALDRLEATDEEREVVLARVTELIDKGVDNDDELVDTVVVGIRKYRKEQKERQDAAVKAAEDWDLLAASEEIEAAEEAAPELDVPVRKEPAEVAKVVAEGTHSRTLWSVEITSVRDLCRAVADGVLPEEFVAADLVVIRRAMHAVPHDERDGIEWPGVDVVSEEHVIVES